jgi:hypothetical protein
MDGEFKGCLEFYAKEEWYVIPELVEKIIWYAT